MTAREEGKRETEENAIELVIEDKRRKCGLCSTKRSVEPSPSVTSLNYTYSKLYVTSDF